MGTQSFPHHLKGRQALPANVEATEAVQDDTILGTEINWATERAAEVAASLGFADEDLAGMQGTGKGGSITVADVKNWGTEPE
jgi:pyruvate/2-oxoglutarate dehydrogenase complex dihydrolipoamide acyltransferase (E2) component